MVLFAVNKLNSDLKLFFHASMKKSFVLVTGQKSVLLKSERIKVDVRLRNILS